MRRGAIVALLGCLAILGSAQTASAAPPIPTNVTSVGSVNPSPTVIGIFGYITSPNPKCLSGRSVKLFISSTGNPDKLLDTATTSTGGYWGAGGDLSGFSTITRAYARVTAKRFGPKKHRRTCAAVSSDILA
jgi:hypothetical protein